MSEQSKREILEKLEGYTQVDNIGDVPLNTHIRYFTINNDGSRTFRFGGFLSSKDNADTYIILSSGKTTWSVQTSGTTFFRKLNHDEEIDNYKKKLADKDIVINELLCRLAVFNKNIVDII